MTSLACCGGAIDVGVPRGSVSKVAGVSCYVTRPADGILKNPDALIVYATDIFGYSLPNARLLADKFADGGSCVCVVPDTMRTPAPADLMDNINALSAPGASFFTKLYSICRLIWWLPGFMMRNPHSKLASVTESVIAEYRNSSGISKVAVTGYCYGGKVAVLLGQKQGVIDALCSSHPGGLKLPGDITALVTPTAFVLTPDMDFEIKHKEADQIAQLLAGMQLRHQVKNYAQMAHGFSVRGGDSDPIVVGNRKDAFEFAMDFFKDVLNLVA
jgi:dienelactone hydrolase